MVRGRRRHPLISKSQALIRLWLSRLLIFLLVGGATVVILLLPGGLADTTPGPGGNLSLEQWSLQRYTGYLQTYIQQLLSGEMPYVQPRGSTIRFMPLLRDSWSNSFWLYVMAVGIGVPGGVLIGSLYTLRHRLWRSVAMLLSVIGLSLPDFFAVMLAQAATVWFYMNYDLKPWPVLSEPGVPRGWLVPVVVLALAPLGYAARLTANALEEILAEDYIRTARSKGLPEWRVILGHAFRNALPRVLSGLPTMLNIVLSGLVVVERLTVWPGLAKWLVVTEVFITGPQGRTAAGTGPTIVATTGVIFLAWFLLLDGAARSVLIAVRWQSQEEPS